MTTLQFIYSSYLQSCRENILDNRQIAGFLFDQGIIDISILFNYQIGYSPDCMKGGFFNNSLIIPIFSDTGEIINLTGYNILNQPGTHVKTLNDSGIFNAGEISGSEVIIITQNPIEALLQIQGGYKNTTFLFGNYDKYIEYFLQCKCKSVVTTFYDDNQLFHRLSQAGITIKQVEFNHTRTRLMERSF